MTQSTSWEGTHYWIIGASAGLGEALAKLLSADGAILTLSARNEDALEKLANELPSPAKAAPCDVTDSKSIASAFETVIQNGDLDGIVFCAGQYAPMTAQTWDVENAASICDVNFTGAIRVLSQYLPYMNKQNSGHIVMIGSLSGFKGIPASSAYGASKAGVMHLAQGLRADLDPDKFKIQLINPGFIKTRLTDKNEFKMPFIMSPDEAAQRTKSAMESNRFQTNYPKRFALIFRLLGLLPNSLYFPIVQKFFKTK
ncbi:SDR family NAD(P)-dependent oxidoreductase [Hirschia baltica]|uniref:Short-chain dehydrogenase/reductase SDR n=1 Tax=Hirschia baltica (strain ATCC 49814 / DSM 5838 / IFAM 1418) TaxID=582402 RepID=C6XIR5_HIRBI|nr:SDR family NAD(P)-dependent oxidoreductase [Hirschia baltica]ACT59010.1 short-chain dehydrogenase/reductase SDR [Hirschia baltica ATCC 49814]